MANLLIDLIHAFAPKADVQPTSYDVRFVPTADITPVARLIMKDAAN